LLVRASFCSTAFLLKCFSVNIILAVNNNLYFRLVIQSTFLFYGLLDFPSAQDLPK